MIDADRLRSMFLAFFAERGHAILPSASLIAEGDPSVLSTTAGVHPLVPYLLGRPHPAGRRLADCQKCLRTTDIDQVGDASHLTFFEMLGNWSLGAYFKLDCADVCAATVGVTSRQTEYDANVTRPLLEACAATCRSCGDECERHAQMHEHCRVCAEACRRCEQACREFLAVMN